MLAQMVLWSYPADLFLHSYDLGPLNSHFSFLAGWLRASLGVVMCLLLYVFKQLMRHVGSLSLLQEV